LARTADAVGADALVLLGRKADIFNPNALRSSTGAVFNMPIVSCVTEDLATWIGDHGLSLIASSPRATTSLWDVVMTGPVALAVGSENQGLPERLLSIAAETVAIPMYGGTDSLNTSVSLALMAYEAVRQRIEFTR
jgi:TrmH family RNA methyltransferase